MLIVDSALWSVEEKKKSGVLGEKQVNSCIVEKLASYLYLNPIYDAKDTEQKHNPKMGKTAAVPLCPV